MFVVLARNKDQYHRLLDLDVFGTVVDDEKENNVCARIHFIRKIDYLDDNGTYSLDLAYESVMRSVKGDRYSTVVVISPIDILTKLVHRDDSSDLVAVHRSITDYSNVHSIMFTTLLHRHFVSMLADYLSVEVEHNYE